MHATCPALDPDHSPPRSSTSMSSYAFTEASICRTVPVAKAMPQSAALAETRPVHASHSRNWPLQRPGERYTHVFLPADVRTAAPAHRLIFEPPSYPPNKAPRYSPSRRATSPAHHNPSVRYRCALLLPLARGAGARRPQPDMNVAVIIAPAHGLCKHRDGSIIQPLLSALISAPSGGE